MNLHIFLHIVRPSDVFDVIQIIIEKSGGLSHKSL